MPTVKGIQCSIELKGSGLCLREYDTSWVEDVVECYVAIPNEPTDFIVHLTCSEYIAPVFSAFVYIDGVFQCNRYKRGLLPRGKDGSLEKSKVDFRFKQKEEALQGNRMLAHPWRFERLNIVGADALQGFQLADPDIIQNVGTIDVVILRGQDNPEYPHFNPYDVPRLPKSPQQSRHRNSAAREAGVLSGLFDGPSDDPLSGYPIWQADGRDAEEWETEDYFVDAPSPPRSRRSRHRQDDHEHTRHYYGTPSRHTLREYLHQQSFRRAYDNEEDDRRQYEAFRAGLHVGREDAQMPQYLDSPPIRHRQEERRSGRAPVSDSASRNTRGHTVVINQFPASNARKVGGDARNGPENLPHTYRHRPNKSSLRGRNVSVISEDTENVVQNVEPLVRKIVKDIVKDVVERLPSEKASSKQDGKPNFHYNYEPEDDDIDGEPMDEKSMPGAYPSSTPRLCIRYQSRTRDALPAPPSSQYQTASQSIDQGFTDHQLTPALPTTITQDPANHSNDLGARSNVSFKPSHPTSPTAPRCQRSASRPRHVRRFSQGGDGKHRSSSRANGQSQNNKSDWDQFTGDIKHESSPNDGWENQENNWDQSNDWAKSNNQEDGNDNWSQKNDNDWSASAQKQTLDPGHSKENNDTPPQPEPNADHPQPPPPPPPEDEDSKLRGKTKTARSLSISQPRTYWYTPPTGQYAYHNQPSNAARKRHITPTHPEQPLYTIPEAAAKARHVEHQVRGGKGIETEHKMGRPLYWDTFEKPYAVIRFKYRSKKCLEEILQRKITENEEEFRERLGTLTKEQLIEECVMRKKHAWDSDTEKHEKAEPVVQQPELEVPWP